MSDLKAVAALAQALCSNGNVGRAAFHTASKLFGPGFFHDSVDSIILAASTYARPALVFVAPTRARWPEGPFGQSLGTDALDKGSAERRSSETSGSALEITYSTIEALYVENAQGIRIETIAD